MVIIDENKIEDIETIGALTQLKVLRLCRYDISLGGNKISKIETLSKLTNLVRLGLGN